METPLVSVIIPVMNAQSYILPLIQMLEAQTYPSIEVILCENGSTDDTSLAMTQALEQYPSNELMDSKLRETVFTILQLKPSLAAVLFDYMQPWRIDLEAFMQSNFKSDLTIEQFAHYTGRSLTAFKNDFDSIFHLTPQRWLTKRRLQEARKLMENTGEKPLDIYLEVGFKSLSHFSTAFKKEYGIPPSQLLLTVE